MNQSQLPSPGPARGQAGPAGATRVQNLPFEVSAGTNDGRARDHNEDAIWVTPSDHPLVAIRGRLMIVADGMGGHNAGEVASQGAVRGVYERYYSDSEPDVRRSLDNAVRRTNAELYAQAQANPAQRGMGTTLTAAVIRGTRVYWAHVGDSRLYLIRGGQIEQLTHDHSWVEEQVRAGVLTRLQAESHPQRNVITRALATSPDVKVDHDERELLPGDVLVLCSDGLNTEVGNAQIAAHATKSATLKEAVDRLIQLANDNGGEDNISVAVIRVAGEATTQAVAAVGRASAQAPAAAARRKLPLWAIGAAAGAVVLGLVGALVVSSPWTRGTPTPPLVTSAPASVTPGGQPTAMLAATTTPPITGQPLAGTPLVTSGTQTSAPGGAVATATLALTLTASPTRQTTITVIRSPSGSTSTPNPVLRAQAPVLVKPTNETVPGPQVIFSWFANGYVLRSGEGYAVMAWRKDDPKYEGLEGLDLPTLFDVCDRAKPQTTTTKTVDFAATDVGKAGPGKYLWTVVVVDTRLTDAKGRCVPISRQAAPHEFDFTYAVPEQQPTPAPPPEEPPVGPSPGIP